MTSSFQDLRAIVDAGMAGQRLDQGLSLIWPVSRRRARRAIDEGGVYVNGKRCRTAGRTLKKNEKLRLVMLENEILIPFQGRQIIWQSPPLYLINKLSGQYAQEALHRSRGTLPDELARHLSMPPRQAELLRPVHRLDRGTSGLMLFCSDPSLMQQLQLHWHASTEKEYLAVVEPAPEWEHQRILLAIDKQRNDRGCYRISEQGRPCDSEARVLERRGNRALVSLLAHTGRTHQLRIHLSSLGCPILGDSRYGGKSHTRLMLHAVRLHISPPALPKSQAWLCPPEEDWIW
ncbi:MAG TPA: RluA family pseudouridine synthase [Mariprofundaceae bacterium]|nr:RluA family pseudouridine synthase [Mariprofundaceae bacterium]